MKSATYAATALLLLATGLWALTLANPSPGETGSAAAAATTPGSTPERHPGTTDLTERRVLGPDEAAPFHLAHVSPDGSLLAGVDWGTGNIAIRELQTGEARSVTDGGWLEDGSYGYGARFSPDGRKLAYIWFDADGGRYELRIADLTTDEVRTLFPRPEAEGLRTVCCFLGAWSPDGGSVAVTLAFADGSYRIALIDAEDGSSTILRSLDWREPGGISFSPDGTWLAYDVAREPGWGSPREIFLVARDGSREHRLSPDHGDHRVAGWLPGGGPLFYLSDNEGRTDLLAVETEEGRPAYEPRLVRSDLSNVEPIGFGGDAFLYKAVLEARGVYMAGIDETAGTLSTSFSPIHSPSVNDTRFGAWSPDGERIAYSDRAQNLFIRSLATGAERRLSVPLNYVAWMDWSPHGDRLVVTGPHERGDASTWIVELETEAWTPVPDAFRPRWSLDGETLLAVRDDPATDPDQRLRIVRIDPDTGEERAELARTGSVRALAPSPSEDELAVLQWSDEVDLGQSEIVVIPVDGGQERSVFRTESPEFIPPNTLEWSPDGEHLLFVRTEVRGDDGEDHRLWRIQPDGSGAMELDQIPGTGVRNLRLHPDGSRIALTGGERRWEIWALEGLDRVRLADDATDEGR